LEPAVGYSCSKTFVIGFFVVHAWKMIRSINEIKTIFDSAKIGQGNSNVPSRSIAP
jgi:hypothetical protein